MHSESRTLPTDLPESDREADAEAVLLSMQDLLGRKWHPIVLYALFEEGDLGFGDLEARIDGVSSKMLSESLTRLEDQGVVAREIVDDRPVRVSYSLTPRGRELGRILGEVVRWGADDFDADADREDPRPVESLATDGGGDRRSTGEHREVDP